VFIALAPESFPQDILADETDGRVGAIAAGRRQGL
jgi:hypothetical protein